MPRCRDRPGGLRTVRPGHPSARGSGCAGRPPHSKRSSHRRNRRAGRATRTWRSLGTGSPSSARPARANVQAKRTIDARGLIVAPGFIDPHTHTLEDLSSNDPKRRANADYLMQGVTTVVTGNDGGGPYEVARTLAKWKAGGIGSNGALLVGYGSVRQAVMGMSDAKADGTRAGLDACPRGQRDARGRARHVDRAVLRSPELRDDGRSDRSGEGGGEIRRHLRYAPAR